MSGAWTRRSFGWCWLLVTASCATSSQTAAHDVAVRHRPRWLGEASKVADAMAMCLESLERPRYVLHVAQERDFTSVTTVDGLSAIQHCIVRGSEVVDRLPSNTTLTDASYASLPLLSLGSVQPTTPSGVHVEEFLPDGVALGWLYWPGEGAVVVASAKPSKGSAGKRKP
jgi:hypothetical protein